MNPVKSLGAELDSKELFFNIYHWERAQIPPGLATCSLGFLNLSQLPELHSQQAVGFWELKSTQLQD